MDGGTIRFPPQGAHRRGVALVLGAAFAMLALASAAAPSRKTTLTPDQRARMFWKEFSWSPDGRHMLLTGMLGGGKPGLYIARANGTEARALTDTGTACSWGAWSPDGRHIAYVANVDSAYAVFVMNADGSGVRRITTGAADETNPSWSPDGSRLAFVSTRGGARAIWTMDRDGASPTQLCDAIGDEHNPVWSPDGQRVAYYFTRDGADSIGIVNADGSNAVTLGPGVWPNWSPHDEKLAFTYGVTRRQQPDVWIMNPDGSGRTRLAGPGFFARWSPNGRDVVFLRAEGQGWPRPSYLYSIRPESRRERRWPAR